MFRTPIVPRTSETDGAGHINNCFVPVWFEAGRREIFRILTPNLDFANWRVILVNTNIDYTDQIYYAHEAEVLTWVEHIGGKSFRLYEEVHQTGRVCAHLCLLQLSDPASGNRAGWRPPRVRTAHAGRC